MSNLSCKSEIPEVKGLEANQMTVGRHLILNCEGDWNKAFDFSKASVKLEANLKNTMKVFKVEARNAEKFDVDMTLYSVGSFEIPDLVLSDGTNEISLGRQQFQLSSVIEKSEDQKPPNPFGPILPLTLSWPAIYAVLFVAVIFSSVLFVIFNLKRRVRFKRLIDTLKTFDSSLDPDVQFYKTMRALEKLNYPLADMEKAFRLYALRVFQVPLFSLNNRQAINFLLKHRPQFKAQRAALQKFLSDFEEFSRKDKISSDQQLQFAKRLYRFVDAQQSKASP